jgi:cytochrome c oxidase subunit IV
MALRVQIWIALLEAVSLFLAMPHLSGGARLARIRAAVEPASSWALDSWRIDIEPADVGRWVRAAVFMVAISWLIIAVPLRLRWFLIVPAIAVVIAPAALLATKHLTTMAPQRRFAYFLAGGGCFLAAKLIMMASALSRS